MGTEDCAGCPQQWYTKGEPSKFQGQDRVGIVEGSFGYRALGVSIRGKSVLSRNLGYEGVAMWLNVFLNDPRVAYPYVKVQVRELVRVVGIVAPVAQRGVGTQGNFVLSSPRV